MNELDEAQKDLETMNSYIETQRAKIEKLKAELQRYKLALESLTPGGSEFSDSPERCVEFVRSREKLPARILRLEAENASLTAEVEAAVDYIEYLHCMFIEDDYMYPSQYDAWKQARAARVGLETSSMEVHHAE